MPTKSDRHFILIPIIREKNYLITVDARLARRPARFIVDTGASGSVLDSNAVSQYNLKLSSDSRRGIGVGATAKMNNIAKHDLTLVDIDLSDITLLALDLSHLNAGLKRKKVAPVVGVLGADLLWRRHAIIDYDRSIMLLSR